MYCTSEMMKLPFPSIETPPPIPSVGQRSWRSGLNPPRHAMPPPPPSPLFSTTTFDVAEPDPIAFPNRHVFRDGHPSMSPPDFGPPPTSPLRSMYGAEPPPTPGMGPPSPDMYRELPNSYPPSSRMGPPPPPPFYDNSSHSIGGTSPPPPPSPCLPNPSNMKPSQTMFSIPSPGMEPPPSICRDS